MMKAFASLGIFILLWHFSIDGKAMGGEWLAEVHFEHQNQMQKAYVFIDAIAIDLNFDSIPTNKVRELILNYQPEDSITLYQAILDRSNIVRLQTLPIHSYELIESSAFKIHKKQFKNPKIIRVLLRADYDIKVLSPIVESDTVWLTNRVNSVEMAYSDDEMCRILAVSFRSEIDKSNKMLQDIIQLQKSTVLSYYERAWYWRLVKTLYLQRIVLVELCGC